MILARCVNKKSILNTKTHKIKTVDRYFRKPLLKVFCIEPQQDKWLREHEDLLLKETPVTLAAHGQFKDI